MRVVVIGNGTAGQTAAAVARKERREAEVIVLERHSYPAYHPCALPYVLGGRVRLEDAVDRTRRPGVEVLTRAEVKSIDREKREVEYVRDGEEERLSYDSLIVATGLRPILPPIEGLGLEGVRKLWDLEDAEYLLRVMGERVAVIGGSATGIEVAASLAESGRDVWLIEMMEQLMPGKVDPPIASEAAKALVEMGVKVMLKSPAERVEGREKAEAVVAGGERIEVDTVVISAGVKPNSDLARRAGLKVGETGGIVVDDRMRTSDPSIYAAGDVAQVRDFVTGRPVVVGLASTALVQGKVAGENAVGGEARYPGALGPFVVHMGEYSLGGVGLTSSTAERLGIEHLSGRFSALAKPRYVDPESRIICWMVTDRSGRLLGAQFFGKEGVRERVAAATLAIYSGMGVEDLRKMEFPYNPM
ncbi:MAG: hypothetical protein DRO06_04245, partial [Thermoproteota archaeon]